MTRFLINVGSFLFLLQFSICTVICQHSLSDYLDKHSAFSAGEMAHVGRSLHRVPVDAPHSFDIMYINLLFEVA